jgi:hypothetical protein
MNNLAVTLRLQGDLAGARALQEETLAASRRVLGAEHPNTLISMDNLAETLRSQGDEAGARAPEKKALSASRASEEPLEEQKNTTLYDGDRQL